MKLKDYYKVLGVDPNASLEEIKSKFREMALKWHPDKNKSPNANEIFIGLNEAYQILSDPEKRKLHDELRSIYNKQTIFAEIIVVQEKFNVYQKYTEEERQKANVFAKMPFKEYTKSVLNFIDNVHTGVANIIGFVFGFGFFIDGILLLVVPLLYYTGKKIFVMDSSLDLFWILPVAFILLFLGDILFYEPLCRGLNIRNRWWKIPIFRKWN